MKHLPNIIMPLHIHFLKSLLGCIKRICHSQHDIPFYLKCRNDKLTSRSLDSIEKYVLYIGLFFWINYYVNSNCFYDTLILIYDAIIQCKTAILHQPGESP